MELKKLHIEQVTTEEFISMPNVVNISEPFISVLVQCEALIGNKKFIRFLKEELGCSYREAMNPILDKTEYMVLNKHYHLAPSIHKVIDIESGKIIGYTVPAFKELEFALKDWKKNNY